MNVFGSDRNVVAAIFRPRLRNGDISAQVTIEEAHTDQLAIMDHPVESGALISDHAFKLPAELVIKCGWSNSGVGPLGGVLAPGGFVPVDEVYWKLLALMKGRDLFDIFTARRLYRNMLIHSLQTTTDHDNGNALVMTLTCREVIVAKPNQVVAVPPRDLHKEPAKTAPVEDKCAKRPCSGASYKGGPK